MREKDREPSQADVLRLRNLALQLAVQLNGISRSDAHQVVRLLHELIEWEFAETERPQILRVIS